MSDKEFDLIKKILAIKVELDKYVKKMESLFYIIVI